MNILICTISVMVAPCTAVITYDIADIYFRYTLYPQFVQRIPQRYRIARCERKPKSTAIPIFHGNEAAANRIEMIPKQRPTTLLWNSIRDGFTIPETAMRLAMRNGWSLQSIYWPPIRNLIRGIGLVIWNYPYKAQHWAATIRRSATHLLTGIPLQAWVYVGELSLTLFGFLASLLP